MALGTRALADKLEALVDETSIDAVLEALEIVCREKAGHLQSNWQDNTSAFAWEQIANALQNVPTIKG